MAGNTTEKDSIIITIHVPKKYVIIMEALIADGMYMSRSEFIRQAIEKHLRKEEIFNGALKKKTEEIMEDPNLIKVPTDYGFKIYKRLREA